MKKAVSFFIFLFLFSQFSFGFGKNKINYYTHNWYVYDLSKYNLFVDKSQTNLSKVIIRALKDSDESLRSLTFRDLDQTFPVIVFPNQIDFQGNNISDEFIDEGTGGFTEGLKNRLVIPLNGNWGFFKRVLNHEMVHVYQFDSMKAPEVRKILSKMDINIPLWFIEGMAEYYSVDWDFSSEEILRDITINNHIVPLERLSDLSRLYPQEYYLIYKEGQAFLKYIGNNFGKASIYKIFKSYLNGAKDPFKSELGVSRDELEKLFVSETRKKYLSMVKDFDEITSFARTIDDQPYGVRSYSKFIPTFVSSNLVAFITYKDIYPKIVLYDIFKREIVKTLIVGGFDENYLEFHITRNNISSSTNGIIVFVSKSGGSDAINIYNISNDSVKQFKFDGIRIISSPDISLDGNLVVFSGFDNHSEDIYLFDIGNNNLKRLTQDIFYDSCPRFGKDGEVYFISTRNKGSIFSQDTDIYKIDITNGNIEKFIDIGGEEQDIFISQDRKYMFFVSTIDGVRNIFVYNFSDGTIKRFSKVISGTFSPKLDSTSSKIVFSAINDLSYDVYIKDFSPTSLTEEITNNNKVLDFEVNNFNLEHSRIDGIEVRNISPYVLVPTVDYLTGAFTFSSDLGVMLLLGLSLSDLLGDQRLSLWFNNAYYSGYYNFLSLSEVNFLLSYQNYRYYFDFSFEFFNLRYYFTSLMNFFTLPSVFYNVEQSYYSKLGFSGTISYPFSTFSRLDLNISHEDFFDYPTINWLDLTYNSVFMYSINTLSLTYSYDSTLWSVVGPVDGIRSQILFSYSPYIFRSDKSFFTLIGDFRKYFMLSPIDTLAFRAVGGWKFGLDSKEFPFYIGGIGTLRGYDYKEFSGNVLFLANLELRIALIRALLGAFNISFPPIFASAFVDAGIVGDNPFSWQMTYFDISQGVFKLKDLKVGAGVGFGILLGTGFKLKFDFASPFDGQKLLDYQNWKTYFQLGYEF
ncbi:MAG: hypothetical protein ACP5PT_01685 [Brevinematia bacterium]